MGFNYRGGCFTYKTMASTIIKLNDAFISKECVRSCVDACVRKRTPANPKSEKKKRKKL